MKMKNILKQKNDVLVKASFWDEARGGVPGGTIATLFAALDGKVTAPKVNVDPFRRKPNGEKSKATAKDASPWFIAKSHSPWDQDSKAKRWTMFFVMAPVNAGVVKWSHALSAAAGESLTYCESAVCNDFKSAFTLYAGMGIFGSLLVNPLTQLLMKKFVLPMAGEGPELNDMEKKNFLCASAEGVGKAGNRVLAHFYLPKDAGCLETSRMLVESALALALDEEKLPSSTGGFWTPATGMGDVVMKRLTDTGTEFTHSLIKAEAPKQVPQ
jgi:short subunit dehydrogenase-like uncharacterized protein